MRWFKPRWSWNVNATRPKHPIDVEVRLRMLTRYRHSRGLIIANFPHSKEKTRAWCEFKKWIDGYSDAMKGIGEYADPPQRSEGDRCGYRAVTPPTNEDTEK